MQNTVLQPTSPVEVKLMSAFIRNPSQIESDTDPNLNQVEYSADSDLSLNPTKRIVCTLYHKSSIHNPQSSIQRRELVAHFATNPGARDREAAAGEILDNQLRLKSKFAATTNKGSPNKDVVTVGHFFARPI